MARQTILQPPSEEQEFPHCSHHWVIEPATGPLSRGLCRSCGEVRTFSNYVESASWGDTRLSNSSPDQGAALARAAAGQFDEPKEEQ